MVVLKCIYFAIVQYSMFVAIVVILSPIATFIEFIPSGEWLSTVESKLFPNSIDIGSLLGSDLKGLNVILDGMMQAQVSQEGRLKTLSISVPMAFAFGWLLSHMGDFDAWDFESDIAAFAWLPVALLSLPLSMIYLSSALQIITLGSVF